MRDTSNVMPKPPKSQKNSKLKKIVKILKFLLTIEDMEVIKSSIESIIDQLEEEIN
jgi:hypothetical protein